MVRTPETSPRRPFSERDADALRTAVARITEVLTTDDTDRVAASLNALLAAHAAAPRLSRHDGHPWYPHVDRGEDAGWADWFLAASALAQILTAYGRVTWGACAADGCSTLQRPALPLRGLRLPRPGRRPPATTAGMSNPLPGQVR
ncbi:ABATE domain-containing protein [Streptomyces sp. NPDC048577]|uniref:ABATE domain-containing protein n=1 Tax=Streptomyces sp. NPDC048577 TaxID=3157209 RepID=UPI003443AC51